MYVEVEKSYYDKFIKKEFSEESSIVEQGMKGLRYGSDKFDLYIDNIEWEELEKLYEIAKDTKSKNRSLMIQISAFRNLLEEIDSAKIPNLKALALGLVAFFSDDVIDGWLYQIDTTTKVANPFVIKDISFVPARSKDDRSHTYITIQANSMSSSSPYGSRHNSNLLTKSISFDSDDIQNKSIPELLATRNILHETEELKKMYIEHLGLFEEYQPQYNKQFVFNGYSATDYWRNDSHYTDAKVINEEEILSRKFTEEVDPKFWRARDVEEKFDKAPFHCYIQVFNLNVHQTMFVHVSDLKPYVYDTSLRDKLVLPEDQRDLIDILVADMGILMEDIIKGKSGGTTILCAGKPGLGKTLSAEVYSEVSEKPLYKVHSGQLGLHSRDVEENLEKVLKRAERWGAVLLLDEADVYIRRRGNDLEHNGVVASFLRTLEYFNGLMFMTTNRGDDVDDAILSRCIAVIEYKTPSKKDAMRIWRVLADQFNVDIDDNLIDELSNKFSEASGRDIKELLKLTSRFAKGKNIPLDFEAFRKCAQFRGVNYTG